MSEVVITTSTSTKDLNTPFVELIENKTPNKEKNVSTDTLKYELSKVTTSKSIPKNLETWLKTYIFQNTEHRTWNELYLKLIDYERLSVHSPTNLDEINEITDFFVLKDIKVYDFLSDHKLIIPQIRDAYYKLREYFPYDELTLELKENWLGDSPKIAIYIRTAFEPDEAYRRLKEFDRDFWTGDLKQILFINVEFV
jgi:hypothetical protein